jgi:hypothetical protein
MPADIVRFLGDKGLKLSESRPRISLVFEENIMRGGMVRKFERPFRDGRKIMRDGVGALCSLQTMPFKKWTVLSEKEQTIRDFILM